MSKIENEYLTFFLNDQEYGIRILSVQEIRGWSSVTIIPNAPTFMRGVINLRNVIIPIIDLRERLNKPSCEYTEKTVVIILKKLFGENDLSIGIVVDAVSDVHKFQEDDIKPSPDLGDSVDNDFVVGMATSSEDIIIIIDTEKLLSTNELYKVSHEINKKAS